MEIKKAVITAAGPNQRTLPLQSVVDRDGVAKNALRIIVEEALQAGIEEICLIVAPGDEPAFRQAAAGHANRITFVEQPEPLGYGHAVHCAAAFTARDPFLLLVGDHLYLSRRAENCAEQLVAAARAESCAVSAVQATHESKLPYYGAIGGHLVPGRQRLYAIDQVVEKPTPTEAEQKLIVPGLRTGHYLCFFGMHAFTPLLMELLSQLLAERGHAAVHLSAALDRLADRERYLALEVEGRRYDIGAKYGLLTAQLALALEGDEREEVMAGLIELLAARTRTA